MTTANKVNTSDKAAITPISPTVSDDKRWQQLIKREIAADGEFIYAVKTTGIYCRPTCPSKLAKRENIQFYDNASEAEQAGFRPCLRCRPELQKTRKKQLNEKYSALVKQACKLFEQQGNSGDFKQIAAMLKISPYHFHRIFKQVTGVTPNFYARSVKARKFVENAKKDQSVTEAFYAAGYNSSSRFYATTMSRLGMKPKVWKEGTYMQQIKFAIAETSLGSVLVAATNKGICAIQLGDDPQHLLEELQQRFQQAELIGADTEFETMVAAVIQLVERPENPIDLPLDLQGTLFQERVWKALMTIPAGKTLTYQQLAEKIGAPRSVRAVASACANNKIAIAIPCHRIIRSDGSLAGYRWGIDRKHALLLREKVANLKPL